MKATANYSQALTAKFESMGFDTQEIQAIKDTWLYGQWGDTEIAFVKGEEPRTAYGACTNDCHEGGNFKGREVTNIFKRIASKIHKGGEAGRYLEHCSDWWDDGSGDMLFIAEDIIPVAEGGDFWQVLNTWARTTPEGCVKEVQPTPVWEQKQSEITKPQRAAIARLYTYSAEFNAGKADAKRRASLKRKIARAQAACERLGVTFGYEGSKAWIFVDDTPTGEFVGGPLGC